MTRDEYHKEWRKKNKDKVKQYQAKGATKKKADDAKRYYLKTYTCATEADYDHYLKTTHCECCGALLTSGWKDKQAKCQDHDHVTGKLRGVLCKACNTVEGWIRDMTHFSAIGHYLNKHKHN